MTRFTLYQHVVIYMLIFQYNTADALYPRTDMDTRLVHRKIGLKVLYNLREVALCLLPLLFTPCTVATYFRNPATVVVRRRGGENRDKGPRRVGLTAIGSRQIMFRFSHSSV